MDIDKRQEKGNIPGSYRAPRTSCPVCGGNAYELRYRQAFAPLDGASAMDAYDVCACGKCGMLFANNIPSQAAFDAYYASCNKYESNDTYAWHPYHESVYQYVTEHFDGGTRICDIGCGYGHVLRRLSEGNYTRLYAYDPSDTTVSELRAQGINAKQKSIFELPEPDCDEKFDVILLLAVLEHIVDLHGCMQRITSLLDKNGTAIFCVPTQNVSAGATRPYEEFSIEHINYFRYSSLCGLAARFGLEAVTSFSCSAGSMTVVFTKAQEDYVQRYIEASELAVQSILQKVKPLIEKKTPVFVYGAGTLCRMLLAKTQFAALNIKAFVDAGAHYQGRALNGVTIHAPQALEELCGEYPDAVILLATYASNHVVSNILKNEMKIANEVLCLL